MDTLFGNVKKLYDNELYTSVLSLSSLVHTAFEHDRTILTPDQEFQLLMFEANSLYYERRYRLAESYYRQALQAKKVLLKQKSSFSTPIENTFEHFSDSEIKYRQAVCLDEIKQPKDAISVLQSISNKLRTPKMNMLLARLQHYNGNDNAAIMSYKDVLRECPLNLEAIKSLLELDVNGIEVNSLIVNTSFAPQCSWLSSWIKAHDNMYSQKFTQAIDTFKAINQTSMIRNNEQLLVMIGECLFYNGAYDAALRYLNEAHIKKPHITNGLMILAILYAKKNKSQDLDKLIMPTISISEYTSENWFVLAQNLYSNGKVEKSAYFAQKAIYQNPRNAEAILLKAKIFIDLKKYREALANLRTVQSFAPYRFEVYKGLVDCYLITNRLHEAQTMAAHAVRSIGQTPRTLVLLARTFLKDAMLKKKVKSFLTKALEIDEYYLPAVTLMAEILQNEGDTSGALQLLKKQVTTHPNCKVHSMLGDILSMEKDLEGALENYTIALNLDPTNIRALAGLNAMGHSSNSNSKQEASYVASSVTEEPVIDYDNSFEMVEISPAVAGEAESESETLWSDVEVEVNQN